MHQLNTRIIWLCAITICALLCLGGCGKRAAAPAANGTKQVQAAVPVIVEKILPRDLKAHIQITGRLEGATDIIMTSETSGRILALNKQLGQWVNKGDEIGRVDNADIKIMVEQAKASVLAAQAAYDSAELNMQSADDLYAGNSISKMEYQEYVAALKNAKASLAGAKANLEKYQRDYANSRFVAPLSGYIANLPVRVGEAISHGSTICGIVNSKRLIIRTGVGESEIAGLRKGQDVNLYRSNGETKNYAGTVIGIGIKPLPNSASYPVEIELDNRDGSLYPGMVVQGTILSRVYKDVLYTSFNNIIEEYDSTYVYTAAKGKAQKQKVALGRRVGDKVIMTTGVSAGQWLVVEGAENLSPGMPVDAKNMAAGR